MMDCFASVTQEKIDAHLALFNRPMDALCLPALYTRKQEICREMAADACVPISESIMVTNGVKHAVATQPCHQLEKNQDQVGRRLQHEA